MKDRLKQIAGKFPWYMKTHTLVGITAVIFILISAMTAAVGYQHYKKTVQDSLNANRNDADLLAHVLREHQKAVVAVTQSYASRLLLINAVKEKNHQKAIRHLSDFKESNPEIDVVFIADKDSVLWVNYPVHRESHGKDLSYRDWYKGVSSQWKPYVSGVYKRIIAEKDLGVVVCAPIFDEKNQVIGILSSSQRTIFLADIIKQVSLDPFSKVTVVDQAGQVIYSTKLPYTGEIEKYPHFSAIQQSLNKKSDSMELQGPENGGIKSYVTFAPIKNIGWTVVIEKNQHDILAAEYRYFAEAAIISFLLFCLIAVAFYFLRKKFIFSHISDMLRADEELAESEERFRIAAESASDLIWEWDLKKGELQWFGDIDKMLGYASGEFPRTIESWGSTIHPEDHDRIMTSLDKHLKAYEPYIEEYRALKKDGTMLYWIDKGIALWDKTGEPYKMIGTVTDVTEKKQSEEELIKYRMNLENLVSERTNELAKTNEKLEITNKELEAFSYSVSHDLRAPLRAIDGFSRIIKEDYSDKLDNEGRRLLNVICENTVNMGRLIEDILNFSRVGRQEMKSFDIDMAELAKSVFEELKIIMPERKLQIIIGELAHTQGDPALIRQVFHNLISNAVKFTQPREIGIIEIGCVDETIDSEITYYVKDNGVGFDMQYVDRLFSVFQRLHSADTFEGTGIGLAIVQRIINRHGGRVWAEGAADKGATFYFSLPAKTITTIET